MPKFYCSVIINIAKKFPHSRSAMENNKLVTWFSVWTMLARKFFAYTDRNLHNNEMMHGNLYKVRDRRIISVPAFIQAPTIRKV